MSIRNEIVQVKLKDEFFFRLEFELFGVMHVYKGYELFLEIVVGVPVPKK